MFLSVAENGIVITEIDYICNDFARFVQAGLALAFFSFARKKSRLTSKAM